MLSGAACGRFASISILLANLLIQHRITAFMLHCSKKMTAQDTAQLRRSCNAALVLIPATAMPCVFCRHIGIKKGS